MWNILQRKIEAAGLNGYRNADPFTAGQMGQRAPAMADPHAPAQAQQPTHAPNTVVPSTQQSQDPNQGTSFAEPAPSQPTATGQQGSSPLDQIANKIYTKPNGGSQPNGQEPSPQQQQQQQQMLDLMNLPMENIQKVAQGMDFTKGISDDTMAKFQVDPETGQPRDLLGGIMELMQGVGANIYTNSMMGSGKVFGTALDQRLTGLQESLPQQFNRHAVASRLQQGGYHEALQPVISNAANQLLQNNPTISPEEAEATINELVTALGQQITQSNQPEEQEDASAGSSIFNW